MSYGTACKSLQSPPSDLDRKPLHYKAPICRDFGVTTGDLWLTIPVSAGQNCRVRDIFRDTFSHSDGAPDAFVPVG